MTREEMTKEISVELTALKEHIKLLAETIDKLSPNTGADVSFVALEATKELLISLPDVNLKRSVMRIRKVLKERAKSRFDEIENKGEPKEETAHPAA